MNTKIPWTRMGRNMAPLLAVVLVACGANIGHAQTYEISGQVTSGPNGLPDTVVRALFPPLTVSPLTPIQDNGLPLESPLVVASPGTIGAVRVQVDIAHPYRGDLAIWLIGPLGQVVMLKASDPTDDGADVITTYPDDTTPTEDLALLDGQG